MHQSFILVGNELSRHICMFIYLLEMQFIYQIISIFTHFIPLHKINGDKI